MNISDSQRACLQVTSPDTMAECYPVSESTYLYLWNTMLPMYAGEPEPEYCDPDHKAMAQYWDRVPADIQGDIINAIRKRDAEISAL